MLYRVSNCAPGFCYSYKQLSYLAQLQEINKSDVFPMTQFRDRAPCFTQLNFRKGTCRFLSIVELVVGLFELHR